MPPEPLASSGSKNQHSFVDDEELFARMLQKNNDKLLEDLKKEVRSSMDFEMNRVKGEMDQLVVKQTEVFLDESEDFGGGGVDESIGEVEET